MGSKDYDLEIGITKKDRKRIADKLTALLADSYVLYLITHNFHWNVTGEHFNSLHAMFMEQYTEQWNAIDPMAERIRALGHFVPGTHLAFFTRSSIKEVDAVLSSDKMVACLLKAQEATAATARKVLPVAESANDQPTLDLVTQRLEVHEKHAWMLRSILGG